jgi:acetyl-CoA C-acetyltransferase
MVKRVAIVGVGTTGFRATTPDVSYRELTYEAATKAYLNAGIEPKDVGAFVSTAEDFTEGYSIADEYSPDQLGAVLKPIHTVPGDFIQSLANAYMIIQSGFCDIAVVQGLSKASNMLTKSDMITFATCPFTWRPLKESHHAIAAMEMNRFLQSSGNTREQCAKVVVKNRRNALNNPRAVHGTNLSLDDVLHSEIVSHPLGRLDIAQYADGAVVCVLASEEKVQSLKGEPIWIKGIGWATETSALESRTWDEAVYLKVASQMAYKMAGIRSPRKEIDFAEINDEYSYKELQHLEALGIFAKGESGKSVEAGLTEITGEFPVNASGGNLGCGATLELDGGHKVIEIVLQLRGQAGTNQLKNARTGLAASWRGVPTTTGAVAILAKE